MERQYNMPKMPWDARFFFFFSLAELRLVQLLLFFFRCGRKTTSNNEFYIRIEIHAIDVEYSAREVVLYLHRHRVADEKKKYFLFSLSINSSQLNSNWLSDHMMEPVVCHMKITFFLTGIEKRTHTREYPRVVGHDNRTIYFILLSIKYS